MTSTRLRLALIVGVAGVVLGITTPSPAQVPATPPPASTGVVRGHITAADTGKPLVRVRVSLTPVTDGLTQGYQPPVTASSSASGQFEILNVAPGLYRVAAARAGYLTLQWGQHRVRESGQTVEVKSGQTIDRVDIALPKGAVLAGRITDELGQAYPGVRVEALDLRYFQGSTHRVPFPADVATTDDRGQFRMSGLQPGSYYVTASSSERWVDRDQSTFGYAATYFPGVPGEQAQPIALGVAEQRTDLAFSLMASKTVRVRGRVQNASGGLAGENVSMAREYPGTGAVAAQGVSSARTDRDGGFEIRDVMPGDYRLATTRRAADGQTESASLHLKVTDADVDNLLLAPRSASTVTGTVVTDDGTPAPFLSAVRVLLVPGDNDAVMSTVRVQPVNADGSFRLLNVGGPFLFRLTGLPSAWMVKHVRLSDDDITEVPFDVPAGGKEIGGMQIVITRTLGSVSGDVVDAKGNATADATVVLFPDDPLLWVPASLLVRTIRPITGGHFTIGQLPPGKYHAAALDYVEDGQEADHEFLESLRHNASGFEILEGGAAVLTLKLPSPK